MTDITDQITITYEQPLNERVRTLLRLEYLFQQAEHYLLSDSAWDSRATLLNLIETTLITSRSDLKTEFIKELERLSNNLSPMQSNPDADQGKLRELLDELNEANDSFHHLQGQIGQALRDHDFISSIKQRSTVPGGTSCVDIPAFHYWLQLPNQQRSNDLKQWLSELDLVKKATLLILRLIRDSARPTEAIARQGFYQQPLDTNAPFQLIRVTVPADTSYFAEISGGKHRFTIRFMNMNMQERPNQADEDISFTLTTSVI